MNAAEQSIHDALAARPEVQFALLFGSRAGGRARPDSDWDLAVFVDPRLDAAERWRLRTGLIAALNPAIEADVAVLNDASPLLAHRALQGRLLLRRSHAAHIRFFLKALAEAFDEQYWNALHAAARARRLAEGRFGRP